MNKRIFESVTFKNLNSYSDFGLTIETRKISNPSKRKNRVQMPGTNSFFDYAFIFGDVYSEREITYVFNIAFDKINSISEINILQTKILKWLVPGQQTKLIDSTVEGFYFIAEIQEAPDFDEFETYGKLTVKFTAYPFKIRDYDSGDDIWDEFSFDFDVANITTFYVDGKQSKSIFLNGLNTLSPQIVVVGNVKVTLNDASVEFGTGIYDNSEINFISGNNIIEFSGKGTVEFKYREEWL